VAIADQSEMALLPLAPYKEIRRPAVTREKNKSFNGETLTSQ
jgi:hypothetical protein